MTGVTGFLGRNLLFEVIRQNRSRLDALQIAVLGRPASNGEALKERIREILAGDDFECLRLSREAVDFLLSRVFQFIDVDFTSDDVHLAPDDFTRLASAPIDWFFHLAGLTDLRTGRPSEMALHRVNMEGTSRVLQLVSRLRVREFCYVGTAYSCGITSGRINPDDLSPGRQFRNPYERSKCSAELLVREFARKTGTRCRYFRPATICGRLLEPPLGAVSKFDVFYSWPAFFARMSRKAAQQGARHPRVLNVRVCYNRRSGLNIVPVDYVAKAMYLVCDQDHPGSSYHLVNDAETPHSRYIPQLLEAIGVSGVTQVDHVPVSRNALEDLYYRTVGALYTPYITCGPMLFESMNLKPLLSRAGLRCPAISPRALGSLMRYAIERDFGMADGRAPTRQAAAAASAHCRDERLYAEVNP